MNPSSMKRMSMAEYGDDLGFISRKDSTAKLDMIGGVEMLEDDVINSKGKFSKNSSNFLGKSKNSDPFNPSSKRLSNGKVSTATANSSFKRKKPNFAFSKSGGAGSKKSTSMSGSHDPFRIISKLSNVNESEGEKGGNNSENDEDQ